MKLNKTRIIATQHYMVMNIQKLLPAGEAVKLNQPPPLSPDLIR